jgi:hypothetical protein
MRNGYGSADKDKVGKEIGDKPLNGPGKEPEVSAMVGGIANKPGNPSERAGSKSGNQGSAVPSPPRDTIKPYVEGGFRNAAMEHKR